MINPTQKKRQEKIWRVQVVKQYSSKRKSKDTPDNFCELRAFIFLRYKPTIYELKLLYRGLTQAIEYTENLFKSLYVAKEMNALETEYKYEEDEIRVLYPKGKKAIVEISGFEVSVMDIDEVLKYFKDERSFKFYEIYRYCAFFNEYGNITYEYDEYDIRKMEYIYMRK